MTEMSELSGWKFKIPMVNMLQYLMKIQEHIRTDR